VIRWLKAALGDPLAHFLLAAVLMFVVFMAVNPRSASVDNPARILVDRPALLEFLQFRTRVFDAARANAMLDAMGPEEMDRLIADFVREEALYREAIALGLDKTDYVIKRRLVQTVEFVAGSVTAPGAASPAALQRYFAERAARYAPPQMVTFTHVYFDASREGKEAALARANEALATLNARHVTFAEAPGWGDRFAYNLNYVEKPMQAVAGHFGQNFARSIFALPADATRWQGPLESAFGFHLVLVSAISDEHIPKLAEVKGQVEADYVADLARQRREVLIDSMLKHYKVEVAVARGGEAKAASR